MLVPINVLISQILTIAIPGLVILSSIVKSYFSLPNASFINSSLTVTEVKVSGVFEIAY